MPRRERTTATHGRIGRCRWAGLLGALLLAAPTAIAANPTLVHVEGAAGERLSDGTVVFCPMDDDCVECPVNAAGAIALDLARLDPGKRYTVIIYDPQRAVRYAAFDWVYDPALFAPREAGASAVTLRGDDRKQVAFVRVPTAAPPPARAVTPAGPAAAGEATRTSATPAVADAAPRPRVALGAFVPFLFGAHFGADPDALGGVLDVSPGFGGVLGLRFGYPGWTGTGPVTFREVGFTYAANRYSVRDLEDPTAASDLTFHRAALSFGLGRASTRVEYLGAVAVGYGGVYDGRRRLAYGGRDYGMIGFGIQVRLALRIVGGRTHGLALLGLADLMHYPADRRDDDHWYGLAPTLGVGLMLH